MNESKIFNIIANSLNISRNKLDLSSDYNNTDTWDSMAITNIIIALEEEFDIDIELDDAEQFVSMKNIITILEGKYF